MGKSIAAITTGTKVIRVIDRDLLNQEEVNEQTAVGIRVLGRRNIEAYLLDDEVITAFAAAHGTGDATVDAAVASELIAKRDSLLSASVARGNDQDDLKSVAGEWYNDARKRLALKGAGSTWSAFAIEQLAPLRSPGMNTYADLKTSIFA